MSCLARVRAFSDAGVDRFGVMKCLLMFYVCQSALCAFVCVGACANLYICLWQTLKV